MVVFVEKWCQVLFVSTVIYLFSTQTRFAIYIKIIIFVNLYCVLALSKVFRMYIYVQYKTKLHIGATGTIMLR